MDGSNLNAALIGALSALVASLLTWLGVRRKSQSDEATALLRAGTDMHRLAMDAAAMVREELQQELARVENARRAAEELASGLRSQIKKLEAHNNELQQQLAIYRPGYKRAVAELRRLIGPEGLDEISDLPEDV